MLKKIVPFIAIFWLVHSIRNFDISQPYDLDNAFSYAGFCFFAVFLSYSVWQAAKKKDRE